MSHLLKKSLLMLTLVATFAVAQDSTAVGQLGNGEIQAVVDIGTGEIILETGSGFQVLGILSIDGTELFDTTAFDATTGLGPAGQIDPNGIRLFGLSSFSAGVFNLGAILDDPFRSLDGVEGLEIFGGLPGVAAPTISVANGGITVINSAIPEPSSLSLFALAGLGVVARRRR